MAHQPGSKMSARRLYFNCLQMSLCFATVEGVVVAILALSAALVEHALFAASSGVSIIYPNAYQS